MLKEKLKILILKSENQSKDSSVWFSELFELMSSTEIDDDEKEKNAFAFCKCFWNICVNMDYAPEKWNQHLIRELEKFVGRLRISTENLQEDGIYKDKSIVLIRFLDALNSEDSKLFGGTLKTSFAEFYGNLSDVIDKLAWLFQLKLEQTHVFPIQRLLNEVIDASANPSKDNLIQLIFSLQLFNKINVNDDEDVRKRIIEISDKYHIEILKILCSGGTLLFGDLSGANGISNNVFVAKDSKYIVIRSTDINYFGSVPNIIDEVNANDELIGRSIVRVIEDDWEFTSFLDVMRGSNQHAKYDLLERIYKECKFNCFMPDSIIVNRYDKSFIGFTNEFSMHDRVIVIGNDVSNNSDAENFWSIIDNSQNGLRSVVLAENRNKTNILTLDFLAAFYKETKEEDEAYIQKLRSLSEDVFYQNQIFAMYFDKKIPIGEFKNAIIRYEQFIKKYINIFEITEESLMTQVSHLIMPYKIHVPYDGDIEKMYSSLIQHSYFGQEVKGDLKKGIIKIGKHKKKYLEVEGQAIDVTNIERIESYKPLELKKNEYWLIQITTDKYLLIEDYEDVEKRIESLASLQKEMVISETVLLEDTKFKQVTKIIYNIGFNGNLFRTYGMTKQSVDLSLAVFKLLWHMQVYGDVEDFAEWYKAFTKLFLNKFYTRYVLNAKQCDENFVKKIEGQCDDTTLFIAKESAGERATLHTVVEEHSQDRGPVKWAFDAGKINSEILLTDDGFMFAKTKNYVEKIVLLTDNILSGGSTNLMIDYYLNKESCKNLEEALKRPFLRTAFSLKELLEKNAKVLGKAVEIKIMCIFAVDKAVEKIEDEWKSIGMQVDSMEKIQFAEYQVDDEVKELLNILYGSQNVSDRYTCIFRAHNMPNNVILPSNIVKIDCVGGIFKRDPEV